LSTQDYYIQQVQSLNERRAAETGRQPLALVKTFGCQMNAHDSEKIETILSQMGYGKTDAADSADLAIYNTCCVRENAENHLYGNLGLLTHIKKERRDMRIILCGCMTQQGAALEKLLRSYRHVDVILGTYNLRRLPELLYNSLIAGRQIVEIRQSPEGPEQAEEFESKTGCRHFAFKASVNIMYGCGNNCSYCIVPYVRGRERSRSPENILTELRLLAADGVKEVMLLGQNVNSYDAGAQIRFADLLERVCETPGTEQIERIRFMTSHPKDLSGALIAVMRRQPKIARHLHLPLQSGSTRVLTRMNRKYTQEDYLRLIDRIREAMPDITLTTDIIVGFPGETEEDFDATLDVVRRARFAGAFTFLYSKRPGTPAADMDGQVPPAEAGDRFQRLLAVLNPMILAENEKRIGTILRVLPEEINAQGSRPGENCLTGRADNNTIVHFRADKNHLGSFTPVKITGCKTYYLLGEAVD
jgi:tRNA-2-methylthio-N6-dimethylallyladenosine synthase